MKRISLYILISMMCSTIQAQTITSSPYSRYALGDLQFSGFIRNSGMGQTGQALRSKNFINPTNPASYSNLQYTSFESGLMLNTGQYKNELTSQKFNTGSLSYLSLGFPLSIKRAFGGAIGLAPFSSSEYNFKDSSLNSPIPYRILNNGSGGLSKLFIGLGKDFYKHFSIGAQANYIFGQTVSNINYLMPFDSNLLGVKSNRNTLIKGLLFDFSGQLHFDFKDTIYENNKVKEIKQYNLVIGGSYNLGGNLTGSESYVAYRSNGSYIDTIANNQKSGNIFLPSGYQAGIMFQEYDHWLMTFEYASRKWSSYTSFNNQDKLVDDQKFAFGLAWTPNIKIGGEFTKKEGRTMKNYLKMVEYRGGFKYYHSNLKINDIQIDERSLSIGAGFPIKRTSRNELAKINFSAEFVNRGTTNNGLISENYIRFLFGITFNDTWFIVRKIY